MQTNLTKTKNFNIITKYSANSEAMTGSKLTEKHDK